VQLGEVDASHGFRVLDYWARNRARYPTRPTWPRCWLRARMAASARPCRQSPSTYP
jgi:hypothetical protein